MWGQWSERRKRREDTGVPAQDHVLSSPLPSLPKDEACLLGALGNPLFGHGGFPAVNAEGHAVGSSCTTYGCVSPPLHSGSAQ